jgi:hypothetical protein
MSLAHLPLVLLRQAHLHLLLHMATPHLHLLLMQAHSNLLLRTATLYQHLLFLLMPVH